MKNMLKNICKGMLIGLANILPGISGGTLAVSMGIYDTLIHCVTHIFSECKKSIRFLLPILFGMGISILGSVFGIGYLFRHFPLQANLLFVGLILGSLPPIWREVKSSSIHLSHIITFLTAFLLVIGTSLLHGQEGNQVTLSLRPTDMFLFMLVGLIAAATMVIPGISGSMLLLLMGYYEPILTSIQRLILAITFQYWAGAMKETLILMPFGIGVILGIFAVAKLIEFLFCSFRLHSYWAIMGLILSSPAAIFLVSELPAQSVTPPHLLSGCCLLIIGLFAACKLCG